MTDYMNALLICLQPVNFLLIIAMVSLGIVFGAIPGLSATLGIALLLPITFGLSTETSFVLLLAIWIGGVSGTFISAVLIGIPGSSSAIATCFDGFPMTKKGQAGKALGIGMTASFIGTVVSVIIATVLSPVIAEFALHLGPWEYFSLCFCAITLIASLSKGNIFKGIMAAGIGLLMGCVGMDPINGSQRFTFGSVYLSSGLSTVAQMLGMFAMCQIIRDSALGEGKMPEADVVNMKGIGIGLKDIFDNIKTIYLLLQPVCGLVFFQAWVLVFLIWWLMDMQKVSVKIQIVLERKSSRCMGIRNCKQCIFRWCVDPNDGTRNSWRWNYSDADRRSDDSWITGGTAIHDRTARFGHADICVCFGVGNCYLCNTDFN